MRAPFGPTLDAARPGFVERFGRAPTLLAAAPGRVNLIGEHTDYNLGFVLPLAIDRQTAMAAAPASAPRLRVHSASLRAEVVIPLDQPLAAGAPAWANYLRGVVAGWPGPATAPPLPGLDVFVCSDLPLGGGLSSSAALEVALATLLEVATGITLDPLLKARMCQRAEQAFAGVPCGIMDQLAAVAGLPGHALLVDCQSESWRPLPFPGGSGSELVLLVTDSLVRHAHAEGAYARRRDECAEAARRLGLPSLRALEAVIDPVARLAALPAPLAARARHVLAENARTLAAAAALERGDPAALGPLLRASHASLRDDFEVSCPELDALVEIADEIGPAGGVRGARLTGGGFGGATLTLVDAGHAEAVSDRLAAGYARRTGLHTRPFPVRASAGASGGRFNGLDIVGI